MIKSNKYVTFLGKVYNCVTYLFLLRSVTH